MFHRMSNLTEQQKAIHSQIASIGGKTALGRKNSLETRIKKSINNKGSKSHFWKGGVTKENLKIRQSLEYSEWRKSVFERDCYACVFCGNKSSKGNKVILNADHIKPFAYFPELRLEVSNGRTLCESCHKKTDTYGSKANKYKIK